MASAPGNTSSEPLPPPLPGAGSRRALLRRGAVLTALALPGAALGACGQPGGTEQASQTLKPATIRFTPANGPGTDVRAFEPPLPMYSPCVWMSAPA
jgi:hypothetical protein